MAKKKVTTPVEVSVVDALEMITGAIEAVESVQASVVEAVEVNKMQIARTIFNEMNAAGTLVRKDFMTRFVEESGASAKCGNTYYQNLRKSAGLVAPKVEVAATSTDGAEASTSA